MKRTNIKKAPTFNGRGFFLVCNRKGLRIESLLLPVERDKDLEKFGHIGPRVNNFNRIVTSYNRLPGHTNNLFSGLNRHETGLFWNETVLFRERWPVRASYLYDGNVLRSYCGAGFQPITHSIKINLT